MMGRKKAVARRSSEIKQISENVSQSKIQFVENCLRVLCNKNPQIMEAVASKLRSGKHLHAANKQNKDASKRVGESLPDGGGKKRILGDITNRAPATKGESDSSLPTKFRSDAKKDPKAKIEDLENTSRSLSLRSQSSKSSVQEETTMFVTATEFEDSAMDVTLDRDDESYMHDGPERPEGVEDFDATCQGDPINVPLYAYGVFRWYRHRETWAQFKITKYLDMQKEMTKSMRAILVDWMVEVQESFELNHETLYLAVKLVDMYLMRRFVAKSKLQLLGATAVFIAAKFDERLPPLIDDFLYICDDSYNRAEFLETEINVLKAVGFDLGVPLSYRFLRRYARCSRISMQLLTLARFILETSLMDYELIEVLDSKIAAAALLLAIKMQGMEWTPTLEYYTEYKESELHDLMIQLNKDISVPPNKHLQTIRMKYSHEIFFHVAKIPPLKISKNGQIEKAQ